jgi:hypothetical protein
MPAEDYPAERELANAERSLFEALHDLLADTEMRRRYSAAAFERVRDFSRAKQKAEWLRLLEGL